MNNPLCDIGNDRILPATARLIKAIKASRVDDIGFFYVGKQGYTLYGEIKLDDDEACAEVAHIDRHTPDGYVRLTSAERDELEMTRQYRECIADIEHMVEADEADESESRRWRIHGLCQ